MGKNSRSRSKNGHQPSQYRALIREAKKGNKSREIDILIKMAHQLNDPYFRALGLFTLSSDQRIKLTRASATATAALDEVVGVKRGWRMAELLTQLAKKLALWRTWENSRERRVSQESLAESVVELVCSMPEGKGRSDAIKGTAKWLDKRHHEALLGSALTNKGFVLEDVRSVIRAWVNVSLEKEKDDGAGNDMARWLAEVDEPSVRAKLLAYLHLQLRRARRSGPTPCPFDEALMATDSIHDEGLRLETLRYLVTVAGEKDELETIIEKTKGFVNPAAAARLLSAAAGRADKQGFPELAKEWFVKGRALVPGIEDPKERVSISLNLALGLARCGNRDEAQTTLRMALKDCELIAPGKGQEKLEQRIREDMKTLGERDDAGTEQREAVAHENYDEDDFTLSEGQTKENHVLALYDTYEGGLKPVHLRAVARAAPLCVAFGLDLALIGFPIDDLEKIVGETITETGVGKGGRYVKQLLAQRRLSLVPASKKEPPGEWGLGTQVATSSHPDPEKRIELEELLQKTKNGESPRLILIMGLGKRGLPPSLLRSVIYHLELTGTNVPLETCTVMGVLAERLRGL